MSVHHSRKRSSSYCEDNVITKYFRSTESLKQSIGSDESDYRKDGNARNDVIVIETKGESDDETENNTSISSTPSSCGSVTSRETAVNTSSLVGTSDSVGAITCIHSKTVPGKDGTDRISTLSSEPMTFNDIGLIIKEGMSVDEVSRAVLAYHRLKSIYSSQNTSNQIRDFCFLKYTAMAAIDHFNFPGWKNIHG